MTPTLSGRWQTRIFLFIVLGLPITFVYALYLNDWTSASAGPFQFLFALLCVGLVLDPVYMQIQRFRWDNDWPFAFQFFFSILEFLTVFGLMQIGALLALGLAENAIPFSTAAGHFSWVFVPSFLALLGGLQIFFVRWRFNGAKFGRHRG